LSKPITEKTQAASGLWKARTGWVTLILMEADPDLPPDVYLEVTKKDGEVFTFPITKKTVTIGRDPSCDLQLTDEYVSRKHCQIVFRGDHFTAIDLGSLNKTVVKEKEYIQKNLMTGTLLKLGETRLRFVWNNYPQWRQEHAETKDQSGGGQAGQGPKEPGTE
jgi:pSer/pThr/pTyr-binding forkhead associated (FHA) protein